MMAGPSVVNSPLTSIMLPDSPPPSPVRDASSHLKPKFHVPTSGKAPTKTHETYLLLSMLVRLLQRMTFSLLPSFLQRRLRPHASKPRKLYPTSYLDGLRGVASFIVFMVHFTENNFAFFTEGYGVWPGAVPSSPLQLPFIRVIFSGRPMVHIFFVISGYVLSYKPLRQMRAGRYDELFTTLASSVFRRGLRLFLPSFAILLVMLVAVKCGLYLFVYAPIGAIVTTSTTSTISEIMYTWLATCFDVVRQSWDWTNIRSPPVNPALWTIPIEFSQSLLLFVVMLGLARCRAPVRLVTVACIIVFSFYSCRWATVEFLGGMAIAEWNIIQHSNATPPSGLLPSTTTPMTSSPPSASTHLPALKSALTTSFWVLALALSLFIAGWPNHHVESVWGIRWFAAHVPWPYEGQFIYFTLGGLLIVASFTQLPFLQRLFSSSVPQYLGDISFSLYLCHNLVLDAAEFRVQPGIVAYVGGLDTFWARHAAWALALACYVPVLVLVADWWWRVVDAPSVRFARWLEGLCVVRDGSGEDAGASGSDGSSGANGTGSMSDRGGGEVGYGGKEF